MKQSLLITMLVVLLITQGMAQTNYWKSFSSAKSDIKTDKAVGRLAYPKEYKLYDLEITPLKDQLLAITERGTGNSSTIISLPNANGTIEQFSVTESSNFELSLQNRFPQIRAFSGKGITDRAATLKLSLSPQGIQTMVFRAGAASEFIEPYSEDHKIYSVYRSQRKKGDLPWSCSTVDVPLVNSLNEVVNYSTGSTLNNDGTFRTMRLAQSCNGEYANYFNAFSAANVANVLAAYNATLTRCNGVYEKDLALHLLLIDQSTDVIFYDPATDPYSTTLSEWNLQLQTTLTNTIGNAAYDIGHMFGESGGGGNAGCIGCVCVNPTGPANRAKGSGITSPADGIPMGDNFDIDYVAHEMGHQLGGNHTFTHTPEALSIAQREVGSGITIMGYAGITTFDITDHSIPIFHAISIQQIQDNLATKTCPVSINMTANVKPVIQPLIDRTIPILTPFYLTGNATDANPQDVLTYCWEQFDDVTLQYGALCLAYPAKPLGPNWISFPATTNNTRTLPVLATILKGAFTTDQTRGDTLQSTEALSAVSRALNFRLTVRDNVTYNDIAPVKIGQTAFADMVVNVTNTAGPFLVAVPNIDTSYAAGSTQNIVWLVNGTNTGLVNCANVKITLSVDGGTTFPHVLAASTPNDGSEMLTLPNTVTNSARVKIEAIDNIFFDISNTDFNITASVLPVKYLEFTAVKRNNTVLLNWKVTNETDAVKYRVEKSKDGNNFTPIDVIDAAAPASINNYQYVDVNPFAGDNYYRIAQVSSAGADTYSGIRKLNFTKINEPVISYPGSGIVKINFTTSPGVYSVKLFNNAGQEILKKERINDLQQIVDLKNLPVGIYILLINSTSDNYSYKIINSK